jgi:hypothetical protein
MSLGRVWKKLSLESFVYLRIQIVFFVEKLYFYDLIGNIGSKEIENSLYNSLFGVIVANKYFTIIPFL